MHIHHLSTVLTNSAVWSSEITTMNEPIYPTAHSDLKSHFQCTRKSAGVNVVCFEFARKPIQRELPSTWFPPAMCEYCHRIYCTLHFSATANKHDFVLSRILRHFFLKRQFIEKKINSSIWKEANEAFGYTIVRPIATNVDQYVRWQQCAIIIQSIIESDARNDSTFRYRNRSRRIYCFRSFEEIISDRSNK